MELRQLRYFIEVAEREHMSEAADHLHVAQSAVSFQISKLEDELGVKLFDRVGRNVKLTHIGEIFLHHVKKALDDLEYAQEKIDEYLNPKKGIIRIGYPSSLANFFLPTILSAFKNQFPDISFHLRQASYLDLIHAVKNGDINIAFLGPVPFEDDLISHVLLTEPFSALLPIQHPLSEKESIYLTELKNDDFILFPQGFILRKIVSDACKLAGFSPTIASEGEDMDAIKGLVSAGIGVSLLPDNTLLDNIPRMTQKVSIRLPEVKRSVGMIIPKKRDLAPSERTFYQFVKDFYSRLERYQ